MRSSILVLFVAIAAWFSAASVSPTASAIVGPTGPYDDAGTRAWRVQREKELQTDTGWLTVAGLAFLRPGLNRVGSDPGADVRLPSSAPRHVGTIGHEPGTTWFEPADPGLLRLDGAPITGRIAIGSRDHLSVGSISFHLHTSGDRVGVRIRDTDSALRRRFAGLRWFSISRQWNVEGRFVPYESPREVTVPNVLGDFERLTLPGEVVFKVDGRELRLQAAQAGRRLWFIFSDRLGGGDTYHIRFLYSDAPDEHGRVVLDFNRAYNPPCAYNPFTTCPLPPPQNRLAVEIDAGERIYRPARASSSAAPMPR